MANFLPDCQMSQGLPELAVHQIRLVSGQTPVRHGMGLPLITCYLLAPCIICEALLKSSVRFGLSLALFHVRGGASWVGRVHNSPAALCCTVGLS